ncbi:MAG: restriction endonuclease [Deltaproteobacteria bacterium]|nr:restriction endonuclease [Deltaproteobacteria bacterium]
MTIAELRKDYHVEICKRILGQKNNVPNFADVSSKTSKILAQGIIKELNLPLCENPPVGQTVGMIFAKLTMNFLNRSFQLLHNIRHGKWLFSASQASIGIAAFDQYEHLADLSNLIKTHKELAATLGGDYFITPDIIIGREPLTDSEINLKRLVFGKDKVSTLTSLRKKNYQNPKPILHASISCKWTIRSDRSQNTRTEALNLIRNRKGKTPHIVCVTAEPMPTRLASLAMGTGDLDCVYHMALTELIASLNRSGNEDQKDMLNALINGKRLRDISDLPFDLAS